MNPWIAEQVNREHIAELRSLGRPRSVSLRGRNARRLRVTKAQLNRVRQGAFGRRRRVSVRF